MELPVSATSYRPGSAALIRSVIHGQAMLGQVCADESALEGVHAFINSRCPMADFANFATQCYVPSGSSGDQVVAQALDHYRKAGVACAWFDAANESWPSELSHALKAQGYGETTRVVMAMEHGFEAGPMPSGLQIIPARAVYLDLAPFYAIMADAILGTHGLESESAAQALIARLDETRLDLFVARSGGRIVGSAGVLAVGAIGVIEPVFVTPCSRGGGIARSLLDSVIQHSQRAGYQALVVERPDGSPDNGFYLAHGFAVAARFIRYAKLNSSVGKLR